MIEADTSLRGYICTLLRELAKDVHPGLDPLDFHKSGLERSLVERQILFAMEAFKA